MKRKSVLKYGWRILSLILLALSVLLPSSPTHFNVINICLTIAMVFAFPLNLIFGWAYFVLAELFGWRAFDFSIGSLYLLLFVFCLTAYFQWFVLVPRLAKFISRRFYRHDLQINLNAIAVKSVAMLETSPESSVQDWQGQWCDEKKRTPVERLFDKD